MGANISPKSLPNPALNKSSLTRVKPMGWYMIPHEAEIILDIMKEVIHIHLIKIIYYET